MSPDEIKKIRLKLDLSQEKFAQLLNVSYQTVNRWESGSSRPSPLATEKLLQLKRK